jgi:hypothetical protein
MTVLTLPAAIAYEPIEFDYRSALLLGLLRSFERTPDGQKGAQKGLLRYAERPEDTIRIVSLDIDKHLDFISTAMPLFVALHAQYPRVRCYEIMADTWDERMLAYALRSQFPTFVITTI